MYISILYRATHTTKPMTTITDANFTYLVVSVAERTLAITGINPANSIYGNVVWGTFPGIPSTYGGSNTGYNGNGVPANAFKVVEIAANAFDSLVAFSQTTLTSAFLPANLKRIGERAFAGVKLSGTLTVPATIDSVGVQAFYNTLITGIVIGSSTNSDIVAHLADLTSVINQEIADRAAADASLDLLKAPIHNPVFTGTATIPNAVIGLATISSASIAAANMNVANLTSASLSTANIVGNAAFAGSVSATGQWTFTVQPKINGELVATESYVNSGIASIAGPGLASALDTLTELASAIGGDPSFATNIITSYTSISATLSTEASVRSAAEASLSSALSTSASSLTVVDSGLSTAVSAESSARIASVSSLSSALSANVSDLQSKNSATSTALSTEVSTRSSEVAAAHSTNSASVASLQSVDGALSTALSAETSARGSAVASLVPVVTASATSLAAADTSLSTALSAETSHRVSAVASVSQVQSGAFSTLSSANTALSTALSTEVSARSGNISLLSASASLESVSLQLTHAQFSIALASETGARSTSVTSLSTSISGAVSSLTSANVSTSAALSAETLVRSGAVSSASVSTTNAVASAGASILAHNTALGGETSVRASQIDALSAAASASVASLATAHSAISSGLLAEGSNRSAAVSAAVQNILSGAPSRFNTLEKIASELSNNQSLTLNASTLSVVSALRTEVSSETVARGSAVASLSATAVPSLSSAEASMTAALSTETSARVSAAASVSGVLSAASVSFAAVDAALSDALSAEAVTRNSAIVSVSQAVSSTAANLSATDTTLSTALSAEVSARQSGVVSVEGAASLAFAGVSLSNTAVNTALVAETSVRASTVASVSSAISASFASLQSTDAALKSSASALSAGLSLKATASYVDARLNTLLSGAPAQLDTLAEMAAALGNNPSFASSITAALLTKGTVADVNSLSLQVAAKAALSEFNSVQGVANNAASSASLSAVISNANAVNATVGALASTMSTLRVTGGTVNASTIAVNGVDIPTLTTRIQELYYKLGTANPSLGTVNPDGTVNYKLNRLANPTLVSSVLGFEYAAGGAINKVNHVITVQFDKDQKSVTVTGTTTTTVNNMVLNSSNQYAFTVAYTGDLAFYEANKTAVSIFALETPYKLAPLVPTVTAPAPMLPFLSLNANTVTVQYTGNAVDVPTAAPLFFQANPRGIGVEWFAVVKQGMKTAISSYASGTDGPFKPPGQSVAVPFNNIVTTLMTDMSHLFNGHASFNHPIASWDTGNVLNMMYLVANMNEFNGFNQPIDAWNTSKVTTMEAMFFNSRSFNQPIGSWNTAAVTNMMYMFMGATAFNQNISGWNVGAVVTKPPANFSTGSALTTQNNPFSIAFAAPTLSGSVTYSGNTASMTYTVASGVTAVQVRKASDSSAITSGVTTSVNASNQTASISVALTENVSIVVVALGNDNGRESVASAQQALIAQFAAPTLSGSITYSGNTASMTYALAAGVTAVQVRKASDGTVITTGVTTSVNTSNQTASVSITFSTTLSFVIVALGNANGRESLPSVAQTLIGQYAAPTLINSVTYSGNAASMTYAVDLGVTALTVLKSDLTALPADVVTDTTINNGSSGRTVSLSLAFTTSMTIVVIAQGNANGSQSAASAPLALVGNFAKPTLLGSITYSGNTASMTYTVASGVTAVSVLQPNLSALPSGATVTTNAVSGTTATLQISLTGSRGSLSFVVVAVANSSGRQSASDTQTILFDISNITFTKSSNLWYFGFNCSDPASVSGLHINIQWTGRVYVNGIARGLNSDWIHDYSSFTISTGANSFLIDDPGYLNNMFVGNTASVSINYSVSGVSKNIATTFVPNPLTGGPYVFGISNINTNINPGTCTLTIPAALEQQRVSQNRGWAYIYALVNAITNETVAGGQTFVSNQAVSSVALNLPSTSWGKQLRHNLTIRNDGGMNSGDFIIQDNFTSNDVFTIPFPTGMFPVTMRSESSIGMNWSTPVEINDIRLWGVAWDVLPSALDVASPNHVSKVRIRMKHSTDSTWRFTDVYNYADGIGYAMFHTGVYTSQGQFLGVWTIEIRSENADGTITTNYSTFVISYGLARYDVSINNLTQLASRAGGYTIRYGDNVTNLF